MSPAADPRAVATAILEAGLAAVRPERLVRERLTVAGDRLLVDGSPLEPGVSPAGAGRIAVVGGGKAAGGMAAGVAELLARCGVGAGRLVGLVSVPLGSGRVVPGIEVRCTRPAAANLPTPAAVAASREMLALAGSLGPDDLAVVLVSGGGSALLAAPRAGVPLEEKIAVAVFLAAAGAGIGELNAVRRAVSDVKGGGLARACTAGRMIVLVLSDVAGDPLDVIASGPCLPGVSAAGALAVLERFGAVAAGVAPRLVAALREDVRAGDRDPGPPAGAGDGSWTTPRGCRVQHVLLGGNATAVEAAAAAAGRLGCDVVVRPARAGRVETAEDVGRRLARAGRTLVESAHAGRPRVVVEGGEAVVRLPAGHGVGGRNQQTVAAALAELTQHGRPWPAGLVVASLGTDGEDGPTEAAGGIADAAVSTRIEALGLDASAAVSRCDAHPLLAATGGLIVTGPTGTNVADLRLVLAAP